MLTGRTVLHGALLSRADRVRQGVIGEARQLGAERAWIEKVETATRPLADPERLEDRPDAIGRALRALDAVVADPADLSPDYREQLRRHLRRIELPADHPLAAPGYPTAADLRAARDLVLARLSEGS